jgi:hypothetical protein
VPLVSPILGDDSIVFMTFDQVAAMRHYQNAIILTDFVVKDAIRTISIDEFDAHMKSIDDIWYYHRILLDRGKIRINWWEVSNVTAGYHWTFFIYGVNMYNYAYFQTDSKRFRMKNDIQQWLGGADVQR